MERQSYLKDAGTWRVVLVDWNPGAVGDEINGK